MNEVDKIAFLQQFIRKGNCEVPSIQFVESTEFGGKLEDGSILISKSLHKSQVNSTIIHELIHAYDECYHNANQNDCYKLACTEIRAAKLSGDCDFTKEFWRLNFKGLESCVRRRAKKAMQACDKRIVDQVFDKCFNQNDPFA